MQTEPKSEDRQVIPRWRSIDNTTSAELRSSEAYKNSKKVAHDRDQYDELKRAWLNSGDTESAAELVAAGVVFGPSTEADKAAAFLIKNRDAVDAVSKLAMSYSRGPSTYRKLDALDQQLIEPRIEIAKLRRRIQSFPRNALLYSEIARHYIIAGQRNQSKHYLSLALSIRPNNRLLLRNFARLSVHLQETDFAISKLSAVPKGDMWIDATLTALMDLAGDRKNRRYSSRQLLNLEASPDEMTELLSAAGTHELRSGNSKTGRKLIRRSADGANDNTVAQLQWSSEHYGLEFDRELLDVEGSFEARANNASVNDDWELAVSHTQSWVNDEPFSERPYIFGSYITAEHLWDFQSATEFAKRGLLSNPRSPVLLNNLAFSEAMLGELATAQKRIEEAHLLIKHDEDLPSILATSGLIAFRSGAPELGREKYLEAIVKARELKRKSTVELAYLHYLAEEIRLSGAISEAQFNLIESLFSEEGDASPSTKKVFETMRRRIFDHCIKEDGFEDLSIPYSLPL